MKRFGRWEWERAVLSPDGPPSPTMRFVLIVISSYVRRRGSVECWPSIRTIEAATGYSQRCIIDQIEDAIPMGWLLKRLDKVGDMQRPGNVYTLTMPTAEQRSAVTAEQRSAVPRRRPLNVTRPTTEPHGSRALNAVPPPLPEVGRKLKGVEVGNAKSALQNEGDALGLRRNHGESVSQFAVRVRMAEAAAKRA